MESNVGAWSHTLQDGLGSVRGVVSDALAVQESRLYAPYGQPFGVTGTSQTDFGFTGEWTDANELVHLRARYYAPGIGLFASRDPLEGRPSNPLSLNRYAYVKANPSNRVDPSGMIGELPSQFAGCTGQGRFPGKRLFVLRRNPAFKINGRASLFLQGEPPKCPRPAPTFTFAGIIDGATSVDGAIVVDIDLPDNIIDEIPCVIDDQILITRRDPDVVTGFGHRVGPTLPPGQFREDGTLITINDPRILEILNRGHITTIPDDPFNQIGGNILAAEGRIQIVGGQPEMHFPDGTIIRDGDTVSFARAVEIADRWVGEETHSPPNQPGVYSVRESADDMKIHRHRLDSDDQPPHFNLESGKWVVDSADPQGQRIRFEVTTEQGVAHNVHLNYDPRTA